MSLAVSTACIDDAIKALEARYITSNPKSLSHLKKAARHLPGANTRVALHYDPFPIVVARAEAARIQDLDGHDYIDLMNDLTAGFYGHSNAAIIEALKTTLGNGISYGGPSEHESRLAEAICSRFPSVDKVRFCNSGTEANLLALQLARAVTGRSKVLAFNGGYHGSLASYLPESTKLNVERDGTLLADYNDTDSTIRATEEAGSALAAIIVEPMMGSGGGILAEKPFLASLRSLANETGAFLIFDEVQTARLSFGGLQEVFGVMPDMTTLGKFVGGGLSFGALGGRAELLDRMDPTRSDRIAHGGTFNNNVLTMVAGHTGLTQVATQERILETNRRAGKLRTLLQDISASTSVPMQICGYGSIVSMHFQQSEPQKAQECSTSALCRKLVHLEMLNRGFYVSRRGTINLSTVTSDEDCDAFASTLADVLKIHREILH